MRLIIERKLQSQAYINKLTRSLDRKGLSTVQKLLILGELSSIARVTEKKEFILSYKHDMQLLVLPLIHEEELLSQLMKDCKKQIENVAIWGELLAILGKLSAENSLSLVITICKELLNIADEYNLACYKEKALDALGLYYRKSGELEKSKYYFQEHLAFHQQSGNIQGIGAALNNLGLVALREGDKNLALDYFKQCQSIYENIAYEAGLGACNNNIGLIYLSRRNLAEALPYFMRSLEIRQKSGDQKSESMVYMNIGLVYFWQEKYKEALSFYNKSLKIRKELKYEKGISAILINMASVYFQQEQYKTALNYFEEALALKEKLQDRRGVTLCLHNIGECYSALNQLDKALDFSQKALAKKKEIGDYTGIVESYLVIATIYDEIGNVKQAIIFAEQAFELILEKEHPAQLIFVCEKLSDLYAQQHKYKRAYELQKMAKEKHTALLKEQNNERYTELQVRFDTQQKEREIQVQKLELEKKALELIQKEKLEELNAQLEITVKKRTSQLEQRNQQLEQFAYIAAHDLKEPLRTVGSFVTLLQKRYATDMPSAANMFLQSIFDQVQNMYQLLEDLLRYSTLINDEEEVQMINVKEILEEVIVRQLRAAIESSGAEVIIEDLPHISIRKTHLLQLFSNLISNAIKFRRQDVACVVRISGAITQEGYICFKVKDNGIGIPEEHQQKIFRVFNRLEKQKYEGTGIGLAICSKIVEIYEGKIWVESEEGKGSCFVVEFLEG